MNTYVKSVERLKNKLDEIVKEISNLDCSQAAGFEGPETFFDCGLCIVCECKKIMKRKIR